jgi:hypothetical protein
MLSLGAFAGFASYTAMGSKRSVDRAPKKSSSPTATSGVFLKRPIIFSSTTNCVTMLHRSLISHQHLVSVNSTPTYKTCANRMKNMPSRTFVAAGFSIGTSGGKSPPGKSMSMSALFSTSNAGLFSQIESLISEPDKPMNDTPAITIIKLSHLMAHKCAASAN